MERERIPRALLVDGDWAQQRAVLLLASGSLW
jgi:hypothetical protein